MIAPTCRHARAKKFGKTTKALDKYFPSSASYNSLQVKFDRRFSGGVLMTTAYTYSKSIDYVNDNGDARYYIDYHRNGRGATAVAPYSTRARVGAPVSLPISWEEIGKLSSAAHFTVETARQYLSKRKADPWRDFEKSRIDLHKVVARKSAA